MSLKRTWIVLIAFVIAFSAGCNRREEPSPHEAVEKAVRQAGFDKIDVKEDRDKRVITLKGETRSSELKQKAGEVAQQAAPGWVVANEVSIQPVDAEHAAREIEQNIDEGIENNFKAVLIANHLDHAGIRFHSKNGVLTLEGRVKDPGTRQLAEQLAAQVPKVEQVVNKLDVKKA